MEKGRMRVDEFGRQTVGNAEEGSEELGGRETEREGEGTASHTWILRR